MLQGTEENTFNNGAHTGGEPRKEREVTPPHKYGQYQQAPQNADEVYVENQYGEMMPTNVTPETRWSRGGVPEVPSNASCMDKAVGKAEEIIGKITKNDALEDKGASRLISKA